MYNAYINNFIKEHVCEKGVHTKENYNLFDPFVCTSIYSNKTGVNFAFSLTIDLWILYNAWLGAINVLVCLWNESGTTINLF